ncbi:MAG: ribonuclease Y [Lentisphaeria bacterium]
MMSQLFLSWLPLAAVDSAAALETVQKFIEVVIPQIVIAVVCFIAGYTIKTLSDRKALRDAGDITDKAKRDAETIIKEARLGAKEEMIKAKDAFEHDTRERRGEIQKLEERIASREGILERKADLLDNRGADLDKREQRLRVQEEQLRQEADNAAQLRAKQLEELERIAGLSKEDAKRQMLDALEHELEGERGAMVRRSQEDGRQQLEREGREVMISAMERYAGDCAYERTTSTIPLPSDEMKGRIIGREGRNIRAIEAATGVSVLIDDTPEAVVISCFDPVRREIARVTMERLIADGRIHPTRVEEMVEKVTREIEAEMIKAGQEAVDRLGLTGVKPGLVKLLGRLKYRFSYSQNVLAHSEEVAYMMGDIAAQLGLDERKARRAGLFHDLGKAVDHEVEGSHATIGADLLKRHGEDDEVINAVACHHEEQECHTPLGILAIICDKLSASRPGARCETTELYLKRLEQLEEIGRRFPGVEGCYAVQAGRELRIIVEPAKLDENRSAALARDIAGSIEKEMRYPGQIKVTVVRETRSVEYAK